MALRGNRKDQLARVFRAFGIVPRIGVETGTWRGDTASAMAELFLHVYTIDLSPRCHGDALSRFDGRNVTCVLGNSAIEVPKLCQQIKEPAFWFLDAHYPDAWPDDMRKNLPSSSPMPLFDELDAIVRRNWIDIIVVDDVRDFGRTAGMAIWKDVSISRLNEVVRPVNSFHLPDSYAMLRIPDASYLHC